VKNLINEGKFKEALQLTKDIERNKNLTIKEFLRNEGYKCLIYFNLGQFEKVLNISEELYHRSQEMNLLLFSFDALFFKEHVFYALERFEDFYKNFEKLEVLFKKIPKDDSTEYQERESRLFLIRAIAEYNNGRLDIGLKYYHKSLNLIEKIDPSSHFKIPNLIGMAYAYLEKGELKLALDYSEKALSLIPQGESFGLMVRKAVIYRCKGILYLQQGDLNRALEYFMYDLEIQKKIKNIRGLKYAYFNIALVLQDKNDFNQAQSYLEQLKEINEKYEPREGYFMYQLVHALILKNSSRLRDRVEAEKILKQIVEARASLYDFLVINLALIYLCDWYFEEFRLSNQMDILDDIQPLIDQLQRNAKHYNSYILLASVKLFQAKLALLQINMVDARKLFNEAQNIAEEHGLQLLAGDISKEHDRLLEELKLWESFKKTQASVSERLKLASVDEVLERMKGRRAIEPLESSEEQPVSLLIFIKSTVLLFSYPFIDEWKQEEDLFGSFLSAFSKFSDEFRSQGLDRAKFGEYTLLLQPLDSFLICYLFRGQTYSAKQKINFFSEALIKDTHTIEALKSAVINRKIIDASDNPHIEELIVKSFMSDTELFRTPFKAYEGEELFVFASYAHADKLEVYPIIDYLNKKNIKIWYDEGIPVSENWKKSIAVNLERCSAFLVFITPQIINSEYVRKEISFALKKKKPFFAVYLKETKLPPELEFEIADIQAMMMYLMSKSEFYAKLKELLFKSLNN
jgi:tetratricopeptide (TPR) repeat protein